MRWIWASREQHAHLDELDAKVDSRFEESGMGRDADDHFRSFDAVLVLHVIPRCFHRCENGLRSSAGHGATYTSLWTCNATSSSDNSQGSILRASPADQPSNHLLSDLYVLRGRHAHQHPDLPPGFLTPAIFCEADFRVQRNFTWEACCFQELLAGNTGSTPLQSANISLLLAMQ